MVWTQIKGIVGWVPSVLKNVNQSVESVAKVTDTTDKTLTYITKVTGATTGAAGAAKGTVDFMEAVACQDGICATVSAIGVCADGLSIATSFIPGPNVTTVITLPVSVGCKVFVWCCKRSKLPWGQC